MVRTGIVGLGKMGLSHLAMLRAHPQLEIVGVCDSAGYLVDVLGKYTGLTGFTDFNRMLDVAKPEALLVATPSKAHAAMVQTALERGMHVFCEKPFVLDVADGERLVSLADKKGCVTQVGYHYRFVGAFREAARIANSGALGAIHHVRAEAYGPVVLQAKGGTWRSTKSEGGGALYDYACHAIDLVNFIAGVPSSVSGVVRQGIYSEDVDDEVYCSLHYTNGASGQLCVNWSDESLRKMSTRISVWGTNGRISADRQECQIFLREQSAALPEIQKGWTVRYTTDLTEEVWYYLRGEEYSAQIDYWARSMVARRLDGENSFRSALATDRVVAMITGESSVRPPAPQLAERSAQRRGFLGRLMGRN
jgi:scyllo-inositol 2-dehydrogenase (NADP+)